MYVMKSEPLKFKLAATFRIKFKLIWTTWVYVSVKILYFHQVLGQKNTKQKSYAKSFKIV